MSSSSNRGNLMDCVITCFYIPRGRPGSHPTPAISSEYALNILATSHKQKPRYFNLLVPLVVFTLKEKKKKD